MLRFISFGSGSCGNCYYIYTKDFGILIDVGIGIKRLKKYFMDYGLSLKSVRCILITHDHADHVKSVGIISNSLNLPVYTTARVHEGIKNNYCVRKKIGEGNIRIIEKGATFNLGDFTVTTFGVPHDSLENIGFKISLGDRTFCLMTDIGHITEELEHLISETDYLVIEANHDEEMLLTGPYPEYLKMRVHGESGHLSNKECGKALKNNATSRLKHVWLCHLSQENNHPELARKTVELALNSSARIDGKAIPVDVLKRNTASNIYDLND